MLPFLPLTLKSIFWHIYNADFVLVKAAFKAFSFRTFSISSDGQVSCLKVAKSILAVVGFADSVDPGFPTFYWRGLHGLTEVAKADYGKQKCGFKAEEGKLVSTSPKYNNSEKESQYLVPINEFTFNGVKSFVIEHNMDLRKAFIFIGDCIGLHPCIASAIIAHALNHQIQFSQKSSPKQLLQSRVREKRQKLDQIFAELDGFIVNYEAGSGGYDYFEKCKSKYGGYKENADTENIFTQLLNHSGRTARATEDAAATLGNIDATLKTMHPGIFKASKKYHASIKKYQNMIESHCAVRLDIPFANDNTEEIKIYGSKENSYAVKEIINAIIDYEMSRETSSTSNTDNENTDSSSKVSDSKVADIEVISNLSRSASQDIEESGHVENFTKDFTDVCAEERIRKKHNGKVAVQLHGIPLNLSNLSSQLQPQQCFMKRGVAKQVLSCGAVVLWCPPLGPSGLPSETTVYLANVSAPRLASRPTDKSHGHPDEPFAWEAREFLRKIVVGQQVNFVRDFMATSGHEHGRIYIGGTSMETARNVAEVGIADGWLEVLPGKQVDEQTQKLLVVQEKAKSQKKGKWGVDGSNYNKHVRDIKWNVEDPRSLVDKYSQKPVKAIIEQVRDGSTVRAFLLPDYQYVTIMLSGVKTPSAQSVGETSAQPFGEEAKFFVEQRILHRDVEVILEGTSNQNFMGSVLHPRGNIAELLLKEGYAKCVDWSIGIASAGATTLRKAEKTAKDKKLRLWKNYSGSTNGVSTVTEVGLRDSSKEEKDNDEEVKNGVVSICHSRREAEQVQQSKTEGANAKLERIGTNKFDQVDEQIIFSSKFCTKQEFDKRFASLKQKSSVIKGHHKSPLTTSSHVSRIFRHLGIQVMDAKSYDMDIFGAAIVRKKQVFVEYCSFGSKDNEFQLTIRSADKILRESVLNHVFQQIE